MSQAPLPAKPLLVLLAAVQFTHILDFMVMMPLGPQLMRLFQIEPHQFSHLVASYTFSAAVAGVLAAFFLDRFDRKTALLFCYAGFLVGTLACASAGSYESLLVGRIVSGAFGGVAGAVVLTMVGDLVPLEHRAGAMGLIMSGFALASIAGVPVGLWLAAVWSWHAPFLIVVVAGVVVWGLIFYRFPSLKGHLRRDGGSASRQALQGLKELLTNRNTLTALSFMMVMVFGHFIIIPFLSPSMVANVGLTEDQLSWFYLVGGVASFFTAPWVGRLADRHGRLTLFAVTIAGTVLPVYLITHQGPAPLAVVLVLAALFFVFAGGRFVPGQAIVTSAVPARLRGSFMSLNASVRDLAAGWASLLGGQIVVKDMATGKLLHFSTLGWIAIAASVLSVFVAARVKPVA